VTEFASKQFPYSFGSDNVAAGPDDAYSNAFFIIICIIRYSIAAIMSLVGM